METKVLNIPGYFAELCLQAFTARQELIDWIKDLVEKKVSNVLQDLILLKLMINAMLYFYLCQEILNEDVMDRISAYNNQGLHLCETLRELKSKADEAVNTVTLLLKYFKHNIYYLAIVFETNLRISK